ncbi:MAG: hypothetical protein ACK5YO_02755, partial [Planctomyces sp.]
MSAFPIVRLIRKSLNLFIDQFNLLVEITEVLDFRPSVFHNTTGDSAQRRPSGGLESVVSFFIAFRQRRDSARSKFPTVRIDSHPGSHRLETAAFSASHKIRCESPPEQVIHSLRRQPERPVHAVDAQIG